jgi:hypothetical protein
MSKSVPDRDDSSVLEWYSTYEYCKYEYCTYEVPGGSTSSYLEGNAIL